MTTLWLCPLLAAQEKWFYWLAPVLVSSFVLIGLALAFGYYVKVWRPKYRGR